MKSFFNIVITMLFFSDLSGLQVNGLTYMNNLKPGETAQFKVVLTSDKETPELVDLKLCDYSCNSEGQHFFDEVGKQDRSNAAWVKMGSHRETVNPGEKKEVYLTITAPNDSTLTGSYWSVLLIEPSDPLQTLVESSLGFQLQVKVRYAYHIVTNVGAGTPSLKIVKKELEESQNQKIFVVDVSNTGNLFLNPKMVVKLYNEQGGLEKTMETQTDRLYPGSSVRYHADAEGLKKGKYTTFLVLDNGDGRIFGDSFALTVQ